MRYVLSELSFVNSFSLGVCAIEAGAHVVSLVHIPGCRGKALCGHARGSHPCPASQVMRQKGQLSIVPHFGQAYEDTDSEEVNRYLSPVLFFSSQMSCPLTLHQDQGYLGIKNQTLGGKVSSTCTAFSSRPLFFSQ